MEHVPVLLDESIEGLNIKPGGIYIDGTLGRGGHSLEIVKRLKTGKLIAIDCDDEAISEASKNLAGYKEKIIYVRGNFRDTAGILETEGIKTADGMLFDLGVSSPQLDNASRGFSYMQDSKLDMRMDKSNPVTAHEIVNNKDAEELAKIFFDYGEERYARQIARAIVQKRADKTIETTFQLSEIIASAIPGAARREKQHPAKRCFQALRIAVGDELNALKEMLDTVPNVLNCGGRICIISFHSLEDRIVKQAFNTYAKGCICPKDFPVCVCNQKPTLKTITRKPIVADAQTIELNPRARSAKLRIAEKI